MSFTLFNALQNLQTHQSPWSSLSSPLLWKQKGHSVHVGSLLLTSIIITSCLLKCFSHITRCGPANVLPI